MLKTLLKKQMLEIFRSFFYDARKGRNRTKKGAILYITFYVLLMVGYLGGLFGFLAHSIVFPLAGAGLGWLYFLIMGGIALILGVFGSSTWRRTMTFCSPCPSRSATSWPQGYWACS